jgi:nucleoside-diphosphate-sugar epimerase
MKISVIGLDYVGCVSAACLAAREHEVVGVDVSPIKVELINGGNAPVIEERIGELTAEVVRSGAPRATTDIAEAGADDLHESPLVELAERLVSNTDPAVLSALDRAGDSAVIHLISLPDARARRANPGYVGHGW